ncbi:MAG: hypothetical protein JJU11_16025 [Candidatus Sumerlaeia bacterium]|nr:hypothetical protein [Candidatus Sumerlaeia bacterium]
MQSTLVFGYGDNFLTFDPARQIYAQETVIMLQVLEPLVRWNNDLVMEGVLATDWYSEDGCVTWVFELRPGVFFHDGTPFTADAVKIHFDRILDPETASTRRRLIEDIVNIEVVDDLTVVFNLEAPNCIFPERLTSAFATIPSPEAIARHYHPDPSRRLDLGRNPVGTGPFMLVDWVPDVVIQMERNPTYWNLEEIHLENLEFWPIRENTTRLILLEQGVLDMATVSFAQVNVAKNSDQVSLQTSPYLSIVYIGFNTQNGPFKDKRVRQAANYAINQEEMVEYVFFGVGEPANSVLPSVLPDYNPNVRKYDYNPEKARELLREAGYGDGIQVTLWTHELGTYRIAADAVVEQLRQVGIRVDMQIFDNAVYWSKFEEYKTRDGRQYPTKEGVYDIFIGGWVGGEAPQGYFEPLFRSGSYSNSSFYVNEEIDTLLDEAREQDDPEERRKRYWRMQEIIVEEAPWIFAFHGQVNIGVRSRVQGFQINPSGRLFFEGVTID